MKNFFEKALLVNKEIHSPNPDKIKASEKVNSKLSKLSFSNLRRLGIASVISLASFGVHAQDKPSSKEEFSITKQEKNTSTYPQEFFTPGSKEYNPLRVFTDLSLQFHPEKIDSTTTALGGGEFTPLVKEMKKFKAPSALDYMPDPAAYNDFSEFKKEYVEKRGAYLLSPGVKEEFDLHDAYFSGKAQFYDSLIKKYKNNIKKFAEDKPIEALQDFSDFDASSIYNGTASKDKFDFTDEKKLATTIEDWQLMVEDGIPNGIRIRDYEWQKTHLEESAEVIWNEYKGLKNEKPAIID